MIFQFADACREAHSFVGHARAVLAAVTTAIERAEERGDEAERRHALAASQAATLASSALNFVTVSSGARWIGVAEGGENESFDTSMNRVLKNQFEESMGERLQALATRYAPLLDVTAAFWAAVWAVAVAARAVEEEMEKVR